MNPSPYTENTLVQQTTAEYLEQQLGWESVYAYNNEDFGPDSLMGRSSDREVVRHGWRQQLRRISRSWAYEQTLEAIA